MKSRTVAFSSLLVALAIALAIVTAGLVNGLSSQPSGVTTINTAEGGTLLVRVFMRDALAGDQAIPNATVTPRQVGSGLFVLSYTTNSSGEVQLSESPGLYQVSVSDPRFQASALLSVSGGVTTVMDVGVNESSRAAVFADLHYSSSSDFVAPWSSAVVAIASANESIRAGDTVFLAAGEYGLFVTFPHGNPLPNFTVPVTIFPLGPQVKATVLASELRSNALWLTLKLDGFLQLSGTAAVAIVTYSASTEVSAYAG